MNNTDKIEDQAKVYLTIYISVCHLPQLTQDQDTYQVILKNTNTLTQNKRNL